MIGSRRFVTALGVIWFWAAIGSPASADLKYPGYFPSFPAPAPAVGVAPEGAAGTWLGGDGAFCCPLDATRSFWSFCDPGVGKPGASNRSGAAGVGNTVAIVTCKDGRFTPAHFFRGSPEKAVAFFPDPENPESRIEGTRFWLRKAFLHKGRLYIFAHQVMDPGDIVYNTKILRVKNPLDYPERWDFDILALGVNQGPKIGQKPLPPPAVAHFGNEAIVDVDANFLFTYGVIVSHKSPQDYFSTFKVTALRIPLDRLESSPSFTDLGRYSEFMTSRFNEWKPGLYDPADTHDIGIPAVIGYTVRYNATLKAWQVVFSDDRAIAENLWKKRKPEDPAPASVYLMTGPSPYGPWSRPEPIARFPEMDPSRNGHPDRKFNADNFCYAVGEQPAFEASDGVVVFTYACGSIGQMLDPKNTRLQFDMKAYDVYAWPASHPQFGPVRDRQ